MRDFLLIAIFNSLPRVQLSTAPTYVAVSGNPAVGLAQILHQCFRIGTSPCYLRGAGLVRQHAVWEARIKLCENQGAQGRRIIRTSPTSLQSNILRANVGWEFGACPASKVVRLGCCRNGRAQKTEVLTVP